jgi:hypothetical protein
MTMPGPPTTGSGWLAVLAGRPVIALQHALADQEPPGGTASRSRPVDARQRKRPKAELFTLIRRDAREHGLSARALADKYGTGKRIVRQALRSPTPAPRKPQPLRGSRIDPFTAIIDDMLQADLQAFPPKPMLYLAARDGWRRAGLPGAPGCCALQALTRCLARDGSYVM